MHNCQIRTFLRSKFVNTWLTCLFSTPLLTITPVKFFLYILSEREWECYFKWKSDIMLGFLIDSPKTLNRLSSLKWFNLNFFRNIFLYLFIMVANKTKIKSKANQLTYLAGVHFYIDKFRYRFMLSILCTGLVSSLSRWLFFFFIFMCLSLLLLFCWRCYC